MTAKYTPATGVLSNIQVTGGAFELPADTTPPVVTLSYQPVITDFDAPVAYDVRIDVSELTQGIGSFSANDMTLTNASLSGGFQVGHGSGTVRLTGRFFPGGDGPVVIGVKAGAIVDSGGNVNAAPTPITLTHDRTPPTVALTGVPTGPVNGAFNVTVTFSESVTNFDAADIVTPSTTNPFSSVLTNLVTVSNVSGSGTTYTATITPTHPQVRLRSNINLAVRSRAGFDGAGNGSVGSAIASFIVDDTRPTVAISNVPSLTNANFQATFTFSEAVTGFDVGDIAVGNGSAQNLAGSGTTYTAWIRPTNEGPVTIDVAANVAQDTATNGNTAATRATTTFDATRPSITSVTGWVQRPNSPINLTFTFSEPVTGFDVTDLTLVNLTASNFTGSGTTYSVLLTPIIDDFVIMRPIASNAAQDAAGNASNDFSQLVGIYDGTPPGVTITGAPASTTSSYTATFTFTEPVSGFDIGDITVGNGTASGFAGSGTTYTALITPTAVGAVTLDVAANAANDIAANGNTAAAQVSTTIVATPPTVAISGAPVRTMVPYTVTFTFSEAVTSFDVGDIAVGNGSASGFTGSGTTYSALITPSSDGNVTVDVAAGVAIDNLNAPNTAAAQVTTAFDSTPPRVASILRAGGPVTNSDTVQFTVTFSETVTGVEPGDFTVTGTTASATSVTATSGTVYTVTVSGGDLANLSGVISLALTANPSIVNSAGFALVNTSPTGTNQTQRLDNTPPTPTFSAPATASGDFEVLVTFNDEMVGLHPNQVRISNGNLISVSLFSPRGIRFVVRASSEGNVTFDFDAGRAQDLAGNDNTAAATAVTQYFTTGPSLAISGVPAFANAPFTATFTFSRDVTGFTADDIAVGNGLASALSGSGQIYTALITPASEGTVTVEVAANVAQAAGSLGNTAAAQQTSTFDITSPTVAISGVPALTNAPFTATFAFSEAVTGFEAGDITVSNGSASAVAGSGTTFTALITPTADGTVTVGVAPNRVQDLAGVPNAPAPPVSTQYDGTAPTVLLSGVPATTNAPFTATITFSEIVTGFAAGDVTVANGTLGPLTGSGTTYTLPIMPSADGPVTIDIAAGVADDAAGNGNTASGQASAIADSTQPTVAISGVPTSVNGAFTATVTFSETVIDFAIGDIVVNNGSVGNFTGSGTTYTVQVTPTADGPVTLDVAANVATDVAGNANVAAAQATTEFDSTAPSVLISGVPALVNAPFTATFTFSEHVTGFTLGDIAVGNGTAGTFAGSGSTYTAVITPAGDGRVTLDVADGVAEDASNNANVSAVQVETVFDGTAPTATISGVPALTNGPFAVTVTFSEGVTGFSLGDISVGNGTAGSLSGSGAVYAAIITPAVGGAVTVDIAAGVAQDMSGNGNSAAAQATTQFDATAPSVAINVATTPTRAPFDVAFVFSETVTGFDIGDISIGNGTASNLAGSGTSYSALVTPNADGLVTIDVAANVSIDPSGNGNTAATQVFRVFDGTAPSVVISDVPVLVNGPFNVTITFSEAVTGFTASSLNISNGSAGSLSGSGAIYTARIAPTADGGVTIDLPMSAATDVAGNPNVAAAQVATQFDGTASSVAISGVPALVNGAFTATFTFSEAVSGFAISDVQVGNGVASAFSGSGATYTTLITPAVDGLVTVDVAAAVAQDSAGNDNVAAAGVTTQFDGSAPTAAITGVPAVVNGPFTASFTFSETVTGLELADIEVGNGTAGSLAGAGTTYTAVITPAVDGPVTVNLAAGAAQDTAGNDNTTAAEATAQFDNTEPTLAITGVPALINGPFTATVTFSEPVTGFVAGDIVAGNATVGSFAGSGRTFTAEITPIADGSVTLDVAAAVAQDLAGNPNTGAAQTVAQFDGTAPTVVISDVPTATAGPFAATFTFSEPVTDFDIGDITVGNGGAATLEGAGAVYTATITPAADGVVTLEVTAGVAMDASGNGNTASAQVTTQFDGTAPTVSISGAPENATAPFTATITFSEDVTGFDVSDIAVTNGTLGGFAARSATSYSVVVTPGVGTQLFLDIAAGAASDRLGNTSLAADRVAVGLDSVAPESTITGIPEAINGPFTITITFSEDVQNFDAGDLVVGGATLSNLRRVSAQRRASILEQFLREMSFVQTAQAQAAQAGATYQALITPAGLSGAVTVGFAATHDIVDVAGNLLSVGPGLGGAALLAGTIDTVGPTVTISVPATAADTFTATFTFSEAVTGFTAADIATTNATVDAMTANSASIYTAQITPTAAANADVTVAVAAGAAQDAAGNTSLAAAPRMVAFVNQTYVRERTQRVVRNFMTRRADDLTAGAPDLSRRLLGDRGASSSVPVEFAGQGTEESNRFAFATGLRQMLGAAAKEKANIQSEFAAGSAPGLDGTLVDDGFDVWMSGSISHVDSDGSGTDVAKLNVGVDYKFSSSLVVGMLAQFDWARENHENEATSVDGTGWLVGPYLAARLHQHLIFDGRIALGQSYNDVEAAGGQGQFDTNRYMISGQLTGDFEVQNWQVAPQVGVLYYREEQLRFTNTQGVDIPNQSIALGRVTFGPKFSTSIDTPDGLRLAPYFSVKGIWDFEVADVVDLQTGFAEGSAGVRGRIEGGTQMTFPNGWSVTGEGFYDGIGSDTFASYGGQAKFRIPLQRAGQ